MVYLTELSSVWKKNLQGDASPYKFLSEICKFIQDNHSASTRVDLALLTLTVFTTLRIQYVKEIKMHSVETVSEVSQKSSVKIVTFVKRKTCKRSTEI